MPRLTEEGQQHRVVVRHDEEVDAGEGGAGLEVAKRVTQLTLLATAADKHLPRQREQSAGHSQPAGVPVTQGNNKRLITINRIAVPTPDIHMRHSVDSRVLSFIVLLCFDPNCDF